ncbi:MAG: hypothetical protein CME69_00860 [Halobacteriovorax sp.]|nr:hypothetical protein [Halobacteriovorax sp.]
MKKEQPNIYKYHDHIKYISDMIEYIKMNKTGVNMKTLSQSLKITPSYLSMIIARKREITFSLVSRLSNEFSLSKVEADFFETLIKFNQEEDDQLKSQYYEKIKKFKKYNSFHKEETKLHNYLSSWLNVAIREMTALEEFSSDPKWIQKKLTHNVNLNDIKKSLSFLEANGYIQKDESDKYFCPDQRVNCHDKIYSNALATFHREFLALAGDSITKTPSTQRQLKGHCMAFNKNNYEEAKDILNEALEKIANLDNSTEEGESVYFVELALFPLTKAIG